MLSLLNTLSTQAATLLSSSITDESLSSLASASSVSTQPTPPFRAATMLPGKDPTARTLEEKIRLFNTDERTNVLVSMLGAFLNFSMDYFKEEFITRRIAYDMALEDAHVNFSASLFTPTTDAELFNPVCSRRIHPEFFDDWDALGIPETITQLQRDQLDALIDRFNQLSADRKKDHSEGREPEEQQDENYKAAKRELAQMRLVIWEGHPEVLCHCPRFNMGYLVSDHAQIQNAFPQALGTLNRAYAVRLNEYGSNSKLVAMRAGWTKPKRDKHFKIVGESIVARGRDDTLAALRKHMEKRKQTDQLSEVLIGAPDDDLAHVVDGFFLDMSSGFEMMDLDTANLYLKHSRKTVLERMAQIRDYPMLVSYTDQASGRHKFAYVTLNPEGIPVASEQPPSDDRLQN